MHRYGHTARKSAPNHSATPEDLDQSRSRLGTQDNGGHCTDDVEDASAPERFQVTLAGLEWTVEREADLDALWDAMSAEAPPVPDDYDDDDRCWPGLAASFEADERLPYWTEIWPSSILLAEWCAAHAEAIRGKRALDLGCGLGLVGMAAAAHGARVVGVDYELEALRHARRIAALNTSLLGECAPDFVLMDWRRPAFAAGRFELVLGGDIMYESRFAAPLALFIKRVLAPQGRMLLAEPSRDVFGTFRVAAQNAGLVIRKHASRSVPASQVRPEGEACYKVTVNLWEIAPR